MKLEKKSKTGNHNIGIDEAKIVCMFFIVILHILGHGGVIAGTKYFTVNYEIMWLLKCFCLCAVNCYAIISGYLLVDKNFKISRICKLWIEVEIFSVFITTFSIIISGNSISSGQLIVAFFPFLSKQYWYFTIYIGVFFLSPYLNLIISKFSKRDLEKMLGMIFILVCIIPTVINFDLFETPTGSLFWMCYCYLIGGYIKKYNIKIKYSALWYVVGATVMWVGRFVYEIIKSNVNIEYKGGVFLTLDTYVSPFCLMSAIGLLFMLKNREVRNNVLGRIISNIAQMSFAVYLVHDNVALKKYIWNDLFVSVGNFNIALQICSIILTATVIYSVCILIEYVRRRCCRPIEKFALKLDQFNYIFEAERKK